MRLQQQSTNTPDAPLGAQPAGISPGCYAAVVTEDGTDSAAVQPAASSGRAGPASAAAQPSATGDRGAASSAAAAGDQLPGVVDLLGLLAYAELVAFFRLADDAALEVSLTDKAALAEMAVAEFGHFQLLRNRIQELNSDPADAMRPFVIAIDEFHSRTAPSDWLEGLVKAYVGDGIAADFYRMVAELLDDHTRALVLEVLADTGHAGFAVARVREAIEADPRLAGRLALWARRLVGEILVQAQRVAADREPLARLVAGETATHGGQLGTVGRMFAQLTDEHASRMATLGLDV
jgi:tRNA-(MS[2]IO[6]A)-hydroxylase (MiaE)-like